MRTEKLIKKLHTEQAPQTKPKINLKATAGKETKMTKKELEKRNNFLLLQLKIISEIANSKDILKEENTMKFIGKISYYSSAESIKEAIDFMEEYNKEYNFLNKDMNINDYK